MTKLLLIFACLLITSVLVNPAYAQEDTSSNIFLPTESVVDDDYFAVGETVTVSGTVNGDVYALGEKVVVDGNVNGDVIVAGGDVVIRGNVSDDVRVLGGQVLISGTVTKNVTAVGGSVDITESAVINGSLVGAMGQAGVYGPIGKNLKIATGDVFLDSAIGKNATIAGGAVTLSSRATLEGNLVYFSDRAANIQSGAVVKGQTTHNMPDKETGRDAAKALGGGALILRVLSFLLALLIGFAFIKLMPNFTQTYCQLISKKLLASLSLGVLLAIILPILAVLFAITLVGIPISLAILFVLFMSVYISKIFVSIIIGKFVLKLLNQKGSLYLSLFAGLVIYNFLGLIPVVNFVVWISVSLIGAGSLFLVKKHYFVLLRSKNIL